MKRKITSVGFVLVALACGGSDNTAIDGGGDATTADAPNNGMDSGGNRDSGSTGDSGTSSDSGKASDASMPDAAGKPDAGVDASALFPCGTKASCDSTTQYCHVVKTMGGETDTCVFYPISCGTTPACSCITNAGTCTCTQSGADITDTCTL